ncbi:segregation and condensation protein B [Acidaminococcus sp. CAG:917]|nr:segregation and condensation protein B [Acidaminococcus sp. CAG:917]
MENIKSIIEAIVFASGEPIEKAEIVDKMPELTKEGLDDIVNALKEKYSGDSGIKLIEFNGKLQFTTNPEVGDFVCDMLTPLREKSLTKSLLEVLATIAYKQPITKLEIDELRGVGSEYAIAGLTKANLIEVVGRRDTVGRPLLYGTTDEFLKKFELKSIDELPDLSEVMEKIDLIYQPQSESLFHNRSFLDGSDDEADVEEKEKGVIEALKQVEAQIESVKDDPDLQKLSELVASDDENDEIPDFLKGEKYEIIE